MTSMRSRDGGGAPAKGAAAVDDVDFSEPRANGQDGRRSVLDAGEAPLTERGRRTRAGLIEAARRVFDERGFGDASVAIITDAAGVSHGTFYTYFESKLTIFAEVVELMNEDFRAEFNSTPLKGTRPADRIERAVRAYLAAYRSHARLMAVLEEAAIASPEMQQVRIANRQAQMDRTERAIRRWQSAGQVDPELDPHYGANALGAMVARFAYVWFVQHEPFELECAVETLTTLYCRGLGITDFDQPSSRVI